ncbi:translation initiation factor IF-3 [Candidatus Woesebacteria bacterium RIFCSPHIGHO2_01_FULL_38_10]|uniref:Translation initiation factor IF-3 n=1 Tax=Candidatus Woesebacteria bacterium RIFCSPLOWO2_01_FULL_39_10b TaxID=1802517 RepID=A0A1F8B8P9_9BACT|nr:MAG: translation initiation factor IF-3 [Candidatus Woesebacteria bacterium RIFCSPHIGHO2_01_FULL_38_10]OGM60426.1 MAG: translation initiation factor IF-3 [Candidatus Woesebacteria bacterium RIFCSPLOWO2_01_FULL_39_10b]
MRRKKPVSHQKKYWRVNQNIHAPNVRVIDEKGKQVGVVDRSKALELAWRAKLDLVEIAPNAKPPVVKIVDLGKFRYEQEKKLQKEKKRSKASELKEIRLSPFIAEHDYKVRLEKVEEFLQDGNKVRLVVVFTGRQMESKSFGYDLLKKILEELRDKVVVDMEPKFFGRHLAMVISPIKKSKR